MKMKWIEQRRSVRTFKNRKIEGDLRVEIEDFLAKLEKEYHSKYKFPIIDSNISGTIGTYGVIKGANTYIGGVLLEDGNLVELGFVFEKIIIYLTSLNIGTCWLGGTFKRSEFLKAMELNEEERLLVMTPIGFVEKKMSLKEKSMRTIAQSDRRKDFDEIFFNENLEPLDLYNLKDFKEALDMIKIGPSASNKQPWRVIKVDNNFHFYLKRTRDYAKSLDYDIQMIDLGIAMYHFKYTLDEKDISGNFTILKQPREYKDLEYISTWHKE